MRAIMVMFDSLRRDLLPNYGADCVPLPNFARLAERTVTFDRNFVGSLPCMPARRELHTGRLNFLHAPWCPLEPFDDSMPELLRESQVVFTCLNKNMLLGDYCYYNDSTGYAMATDSAVAIDFSQKDTMYMHADTFKLYTFYMDTDSMYRQVRGYHKVRSYRMDVQSVCDSLVFDSRDSCITMYRDPIVWNGGQQVLGEVIKIFLNDSTIDYIHVIDQTLSVERIDSVHYNQVAGKEMTSYFRDGEMYETWVNGNVYVDYYMFDDDSLMIGLNYTETSELKLFMKDRKMDKIWMPAATGTIYPVLMIPPEKLYLSNFAWFDYIRPLNKDDIFVWRPKKAGTELKSSYKYKAPLQSLDKIKKR